MHGEQKALKLPQRIVRALRAELSDTSEAAVAAIVAEVPTYSRAFAGPMGETIRAAVVVALDGFLDDVEQGVVSESATNAVATSGAYDLGRGEARSGRSTDALLAAYRVGARVSWQALSQAAVAAGLDAGRLATFAHLVFAYIDQLSASSVAGHTDELETSGRVRQRLRDKVARLLVGDASEESIQAAAERADWPIPSALTVVLIGQSGVRRFLTDLGNPGDRALVLTDDQPGVTLGDHVLVLVPDAARGTVRRALGQRRAVLGPTVPTFRTRAAILRTLRVRELGDEQQLIDSEAHLGDLVLAADPDSRAELRAQVLAPFDDVRESTREKLLETLRAWLLLQGRRDLVAQTLYVHPQTVRYRMGLTRDLLGDRLDDPAYVRDLVVALA